MVVRKRTTVHIREDIPDLVSGLGFKNFSRYVEKLVLSDIQRLESVSEVIEDDLDKVQAKLDLLSKRWDDYKKNNEEFFYERDFRE